MALCTELAHSNVVHTSEIILEDKCIFIVFEYAEHDLLQIIHHHNQPQRQAIPARTIKSILYQLLQGLVYLHRNWVMHRDLKPANIMVTREGKVKIGDLGLARLFHKPLQSLFSGDKVVVTIWYRAPELLLGSRHYTPAVDLWAVGCIFAELLSLPVENLLTPDLLRRLAWNPPEPLTPETVAAELTRGGARSWQIDATAGPLVTAFVEAAQAPEESTETAS